MMMTPLALQSRAQRGSSLIDVIAWSSAAASSAVILVASDLEPALNPQIQLNNFTVDDGSSSALDDMIFDLSLIFLSFNIGLIWQSCTKGTMTHSLLSMDDLRNWCGYD